MDFHYSTGIARLGFQLQFLGLDVIDVNPPPLTTLENNPPMISIHSRLRVHLIHWIELLQLLIAYLRSHQKNDLNKINFR